MAALGYSLSVQSLDAELSVLLIHQNGGLVPVFMIRFSFVVLFLDLQYHEMNLASGAQTFRLGWVGPVSLLHGSAVYSWQHLRGHRRPESYYTPSYLVSG